MGAYKIGEIKAICDIVKPKIGILTGINEQHMALFGNLENTVKAKFELIEALPKDGLSVLNKDLEKFKVPAQILLRKNCSGQAKPQLKVQKFKFFSTEIPAYAGMTEKDDEKLDIFASDIEVGKDKIKFKVISGEDSENFEVNLIGKQNVSNILACAAVAEYLGMSLKEISDVAKKIQPIAKTMKNYQGIKNTVLIDDTYNSNPAGVMTALDYLKKFNGRKIIILPGIIELGSATEKVHKALGKKMSEICDLIIITKKDFADYLCWLHSGDSPVEPLAQDENHTSAPQPFGTMEPTGNTKFITQENPEKVYQYLKNYLKPNDIVLFESRGMESVLKRLKEK
jgi:UDP-N-acetylmuramoyl-tripeptide--D-alanyl-D-alanine ligase